MWLNWLGDPSSTHSRPATSDRVTSRTGCPADAAAGPLRVLVVGDSVPALVLTRLLERDGHAPTHVRRRSDDAASAVVTLVPPALTAVDSLVDGTIDAVPVSKLHVERAGETRCYDANGFGRTPLLLDHRSGRRRLRRAIDRSNRRTAQVTRLRSTEGGVEAAFAGGERVTFDLVVGADGPNSFVGFLTGNDQESDDGIGEWTFRIPRPTDWPAGVVESWHGDAVATASPADEDLAIGLGVRGAANVGAGGTDIATAALSDLPGRLGTVVDGLPDRARYRRLPDPGSDQRWRTDRVAFCGTAAAPVGRLSGLAPSLGVEDAVVLAESLAESPSVEAALDSYAEERAGRWRTIRTAAAGATGYSPLDQSGALGRLAELRAVGFDAVLDGNRVDGR